MRLIVCDRCRQEIKGVSKTGYINLDKRDIASGIIEGNREFDEWDFCDDCLMQIRDFVRMAPMKLMQQAVEQSMAAEEPRKQAKEPSDIDEFNVKTDSVDAEEPAAFDADERRGLAARPKRLKAGTHPKAELIKEMARSGASLSEIMGVAGCSEPTARKYMKEATE